MYRSAAICALVLSPVLQAEPQSPEPLVLKSNSRAVQLDVFVTDPSGRPVHGLRKTDFVVTDNGLPRDIRIFTEGIGAKPDVYSNRLSMRDAPMVTAIVIDAIPRPEGLQNNPGIFTRASPERGLNLALVNARSAIRRMAPGQMMAIYAACPELRVIQDYTADTDRLAASLGEFAAPRLPSNPRSAGKGEQKAIEAFVPPMLSVLRDAVGRMSGVSGRKSVVWISQAYGADFNPQAVGGAANLTVEAFDRLNVPLYAVDTRFDPTCEDPGKFGDGPESRRNRMINVTCYNTQDVSDRWMQDLARATGGRSFSGGQVAAVREYDAEGRFSRGQYRIQRERGLVDEALRFAVDEPRSAYELGFYVPESELDGKVHALRVTVPGKPKLELEYRTGYTASSGSTAPPEEPANPLSPDKVGIDAQIDQTARAGNELRVSLAVAPETVTTSADGVVVLDATFIQTNDDGKQLAKIQETLRLPSAETQTDMIRYTRALKLTRGAVVLHIEIRDQATNRTGSIAIPVER